MRSSSEVCLDLSFDSIFAIEVRGDAIVRWGCWPLPPGSLRQGDPADPALIGGLVGEALRSSGFEAHAVRVTIADEAVVTRVLEVPAMPRRDLTRAAAFLALKEVPIPIDKAAWAWDVVASADTANGVCLVACWRDVVERLQAALVSAHLRPEVVEPRSFALARALDMDSGIVLEAVGGAVRATVVAPGAPPYVEQVPLPLSGAERSQVITGLQRRVIAQHAAAAGADLRPQTVLAGELQPDSIPGLQGMAASQVLNGHKPRRPADLPVGFFLPAIGLAMRGRR